MVAAEGAVAAAVAEAVEDCEGAEVDEDSVSFIEHKTDWLVSGRFHICNSRIFVFDYRHPILVAICDVSH